MRLPLQKLPEHLKKPLLPVYLITGDEPLQCNEAADSIRQAARAQGYTEREIIDHDTRFDWQILAGTADARSLFGSRRLVELRLISSKIGNEGSAAVVTWLARPPEDTVLLILSPKLENAQTTPKWVQQIEQRGGVLVIWPIPPQQLAGWLDNRLRSHGLAAEPGVAAWLAERIEGNLLAGAQEIEKLLLLHGKGPLNLEQTIAAVSDNTRYNVFELADSAVDGKSARCIRILRTLRDEDTASALVLWALVRETRLLATLAVQARSGAPIVQVVSGRREIREHRRPSYISALGRAPARHWQKLLLQCKQADRAIKGMSADNPWILFEQIALGMTNCNYVTS